MNYLLVTASQLSAIKVINTSQLNQNKQINPVLLADGRYILNTDILTDLTMWADWVSILTQLSPTTVMQSDFIVFSN